MVWAGRDLDEALSPSAGSLRRAASQDEPADALGVLGWSDLSPPLVDARRRDAELCVGADDVESVLRLAVHSLLAERRDACRRLLRLLPDRVAAIATEIDESLRQTAALGSEPRIGRDS